MSKSWRVKLKHFVQNDMLGGRRKPFFTSNNMSYSHHVVIYHVGKVVSWVSVTFEDHLVIYGVVIEDYFAMYQIFELCFAFRNEHSNDVWFATLNSFFNFFRTEAVAESIILGLRSL